MPAHPKPPPRAKKRKAFGSTMAAPSKDMKRGRPAARSEKRTAIYNGTSDECPPCPTCKGEGWGILAAPIPTRVACPACGGTGKEGRAAFTKRILTERPQCEVCPRITMFAATLKEACPACEADSVSLGAERCAVCDSTGMVPVKPVVCGGASVDVHEVLARSAGGDILDARNVKATCRAGHDWIGQHPLAALSLGLRRSRYEGRNPKETP